MTSEFASCAYHAAVKTTIFLFVGGLLLAGCAKEAPPPPAAVSSYLDYSGRDDALTGGVKLIPIVTPKGTFKVWTKRVGNSPTMKVLLLHGGPGATHEYMEAFDSYFPAASIEYYYDRVRKAAAASGPYREEPKQTSIHLVRKSAFAGIATRKDALILTLKSAADIRSPRIIKREQASANRWHLEIRLDDPKQVDAELRAWLKNAIALSD